MNTVVLIIVFSSCGMLALIICITVCFMFYRRRHSVTASNEIIWPEVDTLTIKMKPEDYVEYGPSVSTSEVITVTELFIPSEKNNAELGKGVEYEIYEEDEVTDFEQRLTDEQYSKESEKQIAVVSSSIASNFQDENVEIKSSSSDSEKD
ncbi:hypothetical protein D915_006663 [Fasciola hepatica]|uniref:Uncharacterized protein n=1 Tax=Fasciola hepatica TaxID=6192 RepID=A0A4E0R7D2_FASHE|nr:hypothetical protein D915_006663 [Fasciola hepatica]